MTKKIPLAIVGAGRFGKIHIKCISQHPLFELVCVVDVCHMASLWAESQGYSIESTIDKIPNHVEAAVIVVPSSLHDAVALPLLNRGMHLLVEKPLATTYSGLEKMLTLSAEKNCILCVGHIERFNRHIPRLTSKPNKIKFTRYSTAKKNHKESFLDLMVHDLDLAAVLLDIDPALNFDILDVSLNPNGAKVFAKVCNVELYFLAEFNAERSYADINVYYDDSVECLTLLNHSANGQDPLTNQYTSFYKKLQGDESAIADGVAGMAAARRAIQLSEML